jgi:CheY-like chemotaxis protein
MHPVLLADDSPLVRRVLSGQLAAAGYHVLERDSAGSASLPTSAPLACAVLDLELGDGDGVAVALALRDPDPELPLAFFSGGARAELAARAREVGPVFRKPDQMTDLVAWVRRVMEGA